MPELRDLRVHERLTIPHRFLSVRFSRSGGPGGQNVNKVESKVDLRLDLDALTEILEVTRVQRIRDRLANRLDQDGHLQVVSSEHRRQSQNLEAAHVRMEGLLRMALTPVKKRRKTKPTKGSKERRLSAKKQRGQIKKLRQDHGE